VGAPLHVTNAASRKPPYRGPGRTWTIMAMPRAAYGEYGEGPVPALVPEVGWVKAARAGDVPLDEYRDLYTTRLREHLDALRPGTLTANGYPVEGGDTLICACSRAAAAQGRCHRVWAAEILREAGWEIVLDGRPIR